MNERTYAEQLDKAFTYHPPVGNQVELYSIIRGQARGYADTIAKLCPPSRETSLALTKLEEVVMWANAAIARNSDGT